MSEFRQHLTAFVVLRWRQHSLREITRRHEVLRTTFPAGQGEPAQVVSADLELCLPLIDLIGEGTHSGREALVGRFALVLDIPPPLQARDPDVHRWILMCKQTALRRETERGQRNYGEGGADHCRAHAQHRAIASKR